MIVPNPRALAEVGALASVAMGKIAHDIEARAKLKAPVDTGNLQNSIQAKQLGANSWRIEAAAEYAAYVEYPTVHTGAQPFMRPAIEEVRAILAAGRIGGFPG